MKILIAGTILLSLFFVACNNHQSTQHTGADSTTHTPEQPAAKQSASANGIKTIIDSYLELKNALTTDNSNEAASAGKVMVKAIGNFDKSGLPEDQKKAYTEIEEDAREHAEHIGKNAGNIVHQREHFATISEDIYDLVKIFGSGRALYLEHCPMYDNNQGANWISESKVIRNPYLGSKMLDCGTVKEELKL